MTWFDDRIAVWKKSQMGVELHDYMGMSQRAFAATLECPPRYTLGIDEVGCGCWAGPLVVGAVLAPWEWAHEKLRDSKDVKTEKARGDILNALPTGDANIRYFLRRTPAERVDQIGIRRARAEAFTAMCEAIMSVMDTSQVMVVIDGDVPAKGFEQALLPKADTFVPHVMAASLVAKVSRDTEMIELAKQYPQYGFEKHKGYHSEEHVAALEKHGPCPIHRRSYRPVKKFIESSRSASSTG